MEKDKTKIDEYNHDVLLAKKNVDLETAILELLNDSNKKQKKLDEILVELKDIREECKNYKKLYLNYKKAADDRWMRLRIYEKNPLLRVLCSLCVRIKKRKMIERSMNSEGVSGNETSKLGEKYYALYSTKEMERFEWCRKQNTLLTYRPLISMVIPVYNTDLQLLKELVFSLNEQIYDNWEICFANGSPNNSKLCEMLEQFSKNDKRILYKNLEINGGISYNTNQAFEMAHGEFIGMLDHDDLLTPNALAEVVFLLNENKMLDFIYSDQDKVDEDTENRFGALYKPDWSMEMLYSGNYITHFSIVRTDVIKQIGGWDTSTDGAQDWDLFLKIAENTQKIASIPRVLYHWRTASTSTAFSMDTKQYALDAQVRALQNHLDRKGYGAQAHFSNRKALKMHIQWERPSKEQISLIVYDEGYNNDLDLFIKLIYKELQETLAEIIIVSGDQERLNNLREQCVKICVDCSSYAQAYNIGAAVARGDLFVFSTDRAIPSNTQTYMEMAMWALHEEIAMVGPKYVYDSKYVNSLGLALNETCPVSILENYDNVSSYLTEIGSTGWYRNVNAMDWYCFSLSKIKYNSIGNFDEGLGILSIIDYGLRAKKKYRNLVNPFAIIEYKENYAKTIKKDYLGEYKELLEKYHLPKVDPYYNEMYYFSELELSQEG